MAATQSVTTSAAARQPRPRRAVVPVAVLLATVGLFTGYLRMARVYPANSDGASIALQAWEVLHGNVLLRGWTVADVSFYGSEMLAQSLAQAVLGLSAEAVHVVAALTYTLLVLTVAAVAKGGAGGVEAVLRVGVAVALVLAPPPGLGYLTMLSGPDHTAAAVPVLVAWFALERRAGGRFMPAVVALVLAWAQVGDPLVTYLGALPLVLVAGWRAVRARRLRGPEGQLVLAGVASFGLATGFVRTVEALGGFAMAPAPLAFSALPDLPDRARLTGRNLLHIFGGYLPERHGAFQVAVGVVHIAVLPAVVVALAVALYRLVRNRGDIVSALLAAGIVVNIGAYVASTLAVDLPGEREIIAVLPLGAALAGRICGPWLRAAWSGRVALAAVAGLTCVTFAAQAATAPGRPGSAIGSLQADWLIANGYTYGLGTYWTANSVTLASHGRVRVAPVSANDRLSASHWESRDEWYDPGRHDARFVLLDLRASPPGMLERLAGQFGPPARRHDFTQDLVALIYDHNLLAGLP